MQHNILIKGNAAKHTLNKLLLGPKKTHKENSTKCTPLASSSIIRDRAAETKLETGN